MVSIPPTSFRDLATLKGEMLRGDFGISHTNDGGLYKTNCSSYATKCRKVAKDWGLAQGHNESASRRIQ